MAEVETLVESLWELDDDELEAQIGSHAQAIPGFLTSGGKMLKKASGKSAV